MANTINWGKAVDNNTIDWGKGSTTSTNDWGSIYADSAAGETTLETGIVGTGIGFMTIGTTFIIA